MSKPKLSNYWHSLRYLRPDQFYYQIRRRLLPHRWITRVAGRAKAANITLLPFPARHVSFLGKNRFRFLNHELDLSRPLDWQAPGADYTWKYNLHYFDYLHQPGMEESKCLELMEDWVRNNPPAGNNRGWEPYPLSLRLVNWVKFCSLIDHPPQIILDSLWLQAKNLSRRVERHILGNHLIANGKALWFAGIFLNDEKIAEHGRKIILKEVEEQFYGDGGHFELSPMYHAIVLEDMLDLCNLIKSTMRPEDEMAQTLLSDTAGRALGWLEAIVDGRGKIPLLNDSADGIALSFESLRRYARNLGVEPDKSAIETQHVGSWRSQNLSGYHVLSRGPMRLIFDAAELGPKYQPGHAHCDMLSILLFFDGKPVFTDTGVFEYKETRRRTYSRSVSAHNTVRVDDLNQAETWKIFRMGRRGSPVDLKRINGSIQCGHSGFESQGKNISHRRTLSLFENRFELTDRLSGPARHRFESFFHLAPGVRIASDGNGRFIIDGRLLVESRGMPMQIRESEYYPEFGIAEKRFCIVMKGHFTRRIEIGLGCKAFFSKSSDAAQLFV
jgi:uncharacterized heparinase superfamily protein